MIRAVGFDLGETLIYYKDTPLSWQGLYGEALARVAERLGLPVDIEAHRHGEAVLARYNTRLNPRVDEVTAATVFGEVLDAWGQGREMVADAVEGFFGFFREKEAVYEDAPPCLRALKARGWKTGVFTNVAYGMPHEYAVQDLGPLAALVDVVLASSDVGRRKPDPAGLRALAGLLGVAPDEMAYVGNEPCDVEAARAAGMVSVLVDRVRDRPDHGQHLTVPSLAPLADLLARV